MYAYIYISTYIYMYETHIYAKALEVSLDEPAAHAQ
jgi:hypothetical protein